MAKFIIQKKIPTELTLFGEGEQNELARYVLKRIRDGRKKENKGELPKNKNKLDTADLHETARDKKEFSFTKSDLLESAKGKKEFQKAEDGVTRLNKILNYLSGLGYIQLVKQERQHDIGRQPSPKIKLVNRWSDYKNFKSYSEAKNYLKFREPKPEKCRIIKIKANIRKEIYFDE